MRLRSQSKRTSVWSIFSAAESASESAHVDENSSTTAKEDNPQLSSYPVNAPVTAGDDTRLQGRTLPPPLAIASSIPFVNANDDSRVVPGQAATSPSPSSSVTPYEPFTPIPRPQPPGDASDKTPRRASWWKALKKASKESDVDDATQYAWIAGRETQFPYDLTVLTSGSKVPELWEESGDTLVYLFPRTSGKGPSFRVHSSIFSSSRDLSNYAFNDNFTTLNMYGSSDTANDALSQTNELAHTGSRRWSSADVPSYLQPWNPQSRRTSYFNKNDLLHLYLPLSLSTDAAVEEKPLSAQDVEKLMTARNLFAFLLGQSLVCCDGQNTLFSVFMNIAKVLKNLHFTNLDGSTFGEIASTSFDCYVDELKMADVRSSVQKTIESLVLGEHMKSELLYNEAFTHAVGKYEAIQSLVEQRPTLAKKFQMVSALTRNRLERAAIDLQNRITTVDIKLSDFEFPGLFAGVWMSKSLTERKMVSTDNWKNAFMTARRQVLAFYRAQYGSWPPRADTRSRFKNPGLNRLVVKDLYEDFSDLYDLWVDRASPTTRFASSPSEVVEPPAPTEPPAKRIQRRLFDEYDRSTPPVQPPIPYDTVLQPSLRGIRHDFGNGDSKKDRKALQKKLHDDEIARVLDAACNQDVLHSEASQRPFVTFMRDWELKQARGRSMNEISDLRCGMWLLVYVVMQSLPMLVIDAPQVHFHEGAEYFLCKPPPSAAPWLTGASATGQSKFYRIAGGGGVVNLPSDLVEHGVEGIYHRSHCWQRAEQWSGATGRAQDPDSLSFYGDEEAQQSSVSEAAYPFSPIPTLGSSLAEGSFGNIPSLSSTLTGSVSGRSTPRSFSRPGTSSGAAFSRLSMHSPVRGSNRDSMWSIGLEALPIPGNIRPASCDPGRSRPASAIEPTDDTFDKILDKIHKPKEECKGSNVKANAEKSEKQVEGGWWTTWKKKR